MLRISISYKRTYKKLELLRFAKVIALLFSLMITDYLFAQSQESGYTREYNGKEEKTALSGVELNISGSSSTISDENGYFELNFPILKPGQNVVCNEIYKEGYVIFNNDAINAWRISNNHQPFIILLCKEKNFRELKKKYYNIFEKSYRKEYELQKEKAIQEAVSREMLQTKLENIEREYAEKIQNINTYIEIFSRIDLNSMNAIEAEALRLLEAEDIDAAIRKYEELSISQKSEEQIIKLTSGIMVKQAGEEIINTAHNDLIVLAEKLKTQLGLYEAGGNTYDTKKKETIKQLVNLYRSLNEAFNGAYNEELGIWLIQCSFLEFRREKYLQLVREAAALPSSDGLCELGRVYEILSYDNDSLLLKAYTCYRMSDSLYIEKRDTSGISAAALRLQQLPVTSLVSENMELYVRIIDDKKHLMSICPKSMMAYCKAAGDIILPSKIKYNGMTYHIAQIDKDAFAFNKYPFQVTIPASIKTIEVNAFKAAELEEVTFLGKNTIALSNEYDDAIPMSTIIHAPYNAPQMYDWLEDRYLDVDKKDASKLPASVELIKYLIHETRDVEEKIDYYYDLADMFSDTTSILFDINYAKEALLQVEKICKTYPDNEVKAEGYYDLITEYYGQKDRILYDSLKSYTLTNKIIKLGKKYHKDGYYLLGCLYYQDKTYDKALEYYIKSIEAGGIEAVEKVAMMKASGKGTDQNVIEALKIMTELISLVPSRAESYTVLGEIYLIQGDTIMAKQSCDSALSHIHSMFKERYMSHSHLYNICYPMAPEMSSKGISSLDKQQLQKFINLVQIISKIQYEKLHNTPLRVEYEELLSIGIIALQVLIKNKTEQQLKKYNDAYIISAIRWALHNELMIRYDRAYKLYITDYADIIGEYYHYGYDDSFFVRLIIYQNILDVYSYYLSHTEMEFSDELVQIAEKIYQSMNKMSDKMYDIAKSVLVEKIFPENISKNTSMSVDEILGTTQKIVELIREQLNTLVSHEEVTDNHAQLQKESTDTITKPKLNNSATEENVKEAMDRKETLLSRYTNVVLAVASIEQSYYSNLIENEEALSIAYIALNVLIKNKSEEQLKKYNPVYLATAIRFAIENELQIRYSLPRHEKVGYFMTPMSETEQTFDVMISMYRTIGLFCTWYNEKNYRDIMCDESVKFIIDQGTQIRQKIGKIDNERDRGILTYLVFETGDVNELLKKYDVALDYVTDLMMNTFRNNYK